MANSILDNNKTRSSVPRNNPMQMLQQFKQFRNGFQGNPQQMVQHMLQTGRITEAQLNQAVQMAKQFQQFVK